MGGSLIMQAKRQLKSEGYSWKIKSSLPFSAMVIEQRMKLQGQKYKIQYSLLQEQWQIYILRKNNPRYLVTVYDLIQDKDSFCSNDREVSVVIQTIPYRLNDLGSLSFPDAIYILKCILEGYTKLVKNKVQFYLLDDANICFTKKGHCKFWINQNLYLSKPHPNRIVPESTFIATILEIVQMRIDEMNEQYLAMKAICQKLTLQKMLDIVNCFHNAKVTFISSISSMGMLYSPSFSSQSNSVVYPHKSINPESFINQDVCFQVQQAKSKKGSKSQQKRVHRYWIIKEAQSFFQQEQQKSITIERQKRSYGKAVCFPSQNTNNQYNKIQLKCYLQIK